jgi:hypothetical protein
MRRATPHPARNNAPSDGLGFGSKINNPRAGRPAGPACREPLDLGSHRNKEAARSPPTPPCFGDRAASRHFGWRRGSTASWRRSRRDRGGAGSRTENVAETPLPAAVVRRGDRRLLHHPGPRRSGAQPRLIRRRPGTAGGGSPYSPAMRPGASRRTLRNCRSCRAKRAAGCNRLIVC